MSANKVLASYLDYTPKTVKVVWSNVEIREARKVVDGDGWGL